MGTEKSGGGSVRLSILTQEGVVAIHQASLEILEGTGVVVDSPTALQILGDSGAIIEGEKVRIPAFLVEDALESAPAQITIFDRAGEPSLLLGGDRCYFESAVALKMILDPFTRSRRRFVSEDYRMTTSVIDACPNISSAVAGGSEDVPLEVRPQVGFKNSVINMKKPLTCGGYDAQDLADQFEVAAVVAGSYERLRQAPSIIAIALPVSPLCLYDDQTGKLLLAAQEGIPVAWYPALSAGTTAPCTPAGMLALANAEVLAGLVLHQLRRPGAPFIYGAMPGMTDMRSMLYSYGSPDMALYLAAATDIARFYGLPMYSTGGCSDAHSPDQQAVAEATIMCMLGKLSGASVIHDLGMLGACEFISPEMIVLCDEVIGMIDHATTRIDTGPEDLALDLIREVGPGGHYLSSEHTLVNFRRLWYGEIFLREPVTGPGADRPDAVRERINERTRHIIETHRVAPLPEAVIGDLDELETKWRARAGLREGG